MAQTPRKPKSTGRQPRGTPAARRRPSTSSDRVTPSNPPKLGKIHRPYYSSAVRTTAGPLLFISGQVGWDKNHKVVGVGDIKKQTNQLLKNLKVVLDEHGATFNDIVKIVVYVTDMRYFEDIAAVRYKYFRKEGPASTIIQVANLAVPELMIEIDAIAVCA